MILNENIYKTLGIAEKSEIKGEEVKRVVEDVLANVFDKNVDIIKNYADYNQENLIDNMENEQPKLTEKIFDDLEKNGIDIFSLGEISSVIQDVMIKTVVNDKLNNENHIEKFIAPEKYNGEKLFQTLIKNGNIKKDDILRKFAKGEIYESVNGKAVFPINDKIGNMTGAYEIDIKNGEKEPKLIENSKTENKELFEEIKFIAEDIQAENGMEIGE